jgi:anaerobic selenocysteine-containing dehydrogenase
VAGLAASFGSGAMTNSIPEFETDTNCFFIIGSNTSEAHPLISRRIIKAQKRGAKVIVVDPRKTQISHWADIYYSFRPGTDVALLNGLMNIIISEGWHDDVFIRERTEDFEALKSVVAEYTPERVAEICEMPVDGIREIARTYAQIKPAAILYCLGITEHITGVDNVKSVANRHGDWQSVHPGRRREPAARAKQCTRRLRYGRAAQRLSWLSSRHFRGSPKEIPGRLGWGGTATSRLDEYRDDFCCR